MDNEEKCTRRWSSGYSLWGLLQRCWCTDHVIALQSLPGPLHVKRNVHPSLHPLLHLGHLDSTDAEEQQCVPCHTCLTCQSERLCNSLPDHGISWRGKTIHYCALSHDWTANVHVSVMCDVTCVWCVVTRLPLGPPVIVISPESASVNMSQNALLRCQAVADPPNMTYVWLKDGENVYHVVWVHSLLFAPDWSILTLCLKHILFLLVSSELPSLRRHVFFNVFLLQGTVGKQAA